MGWLRELEKAEDQLVSRIRRQKQTIRVHHRMINRHHLLHKSRAQLDKFEQASFRFLDEFDLKKKGVEWKDETNLVLIEQENEIYLKQILMLEEEIRRKEMLSKLKEKSTIQMLLKDIQTIEMVIIYFWSNLKMRDIMLKRNYLSQKNEARKVPKFGKESFEDLSLELNGEFSTFDSRNIQLDIPTPSV